MTTSDPFLDLLVDLALERLAAALEADVNVHLHQLKDHSNEYDSIHFPERFAQFAPADKENHWLKTPAGRDYIARLSRYYPYTRPASAAQSVGTPTTERGPGGSPHGRD